MSVFDLFPPKPVHDYVDLPPEAPQPRMWKSLGHAGPGIEIHYALETFCGELDVDREAELRYELLGIGQTMAGEGAEIEGLVLAQQFGQRHVVRFVACSCGTGLYTTRN